MVIAPVSRLSLSLPPDLLDQLDRLVSRSKLPSRSHAVVAMIRQALVDHACEAGDQVIAGTITLVYDNRRSAIRNQLSRIQSRFIKEIISSQHVFLEQHHSLEVLLVQGPADRLSELADALRGVKSVQHVKVALTTTLLPPLH